jgi:hypothetical protein
MRRALVIQSKDLIAELHNLEAMNDKDSRVSNSIWL